MGGLLGGYFLPSGQPSVVALTSSFQRLLSLLCSIKTSSFTMDHQNIKHVEVYNRISYEVMCATLAALRLVDEGCEAVRTSALPRTRENLIAAFRSLWINNPMKPRYISYRKKEHLSVVATFGDATVTTGAQEVAPGVFNVRFLILEYKKTLRVRIPYFLEESVSSKWPHPTWSEANGATPCVITQKVVSAGAYAGLLQGVTAFLPCTKTVQCDMTAALALYCNKPLTNMIAE